MAKSVEERLRNGSREDIRSLVADGSITLRQALGAPALKSCVWVGSTVERKHFFPGFPDTNMESDGSVSARIREMSRRAGVRASRDAGMTIMTATTGDCNQRLEPWSLGRGLTQKAPTYLGWLSVGEAPRPTTLYQMDTSLAEKIKALPEGQVMGYALGLADDGSFRELARDFSSLEPTSSLISNSPQGHAVQVALPVYAREFLAFGEPSGKVLAAAPRVPDDVTRLVFRG